MFLQVSGDGEANKVFKDETDRIHYRFVNIHTPDKPDQLPQGRQTVYIHDPRKPHDIADASVNFTKREPQSVRIGKQFYRSIWDFVGYCVISEKKITYKNNRKYKWVIEPESVKLEPRGQKSEPLAVFNSVCVGDPRDNILLEVLYIAENLRGLSKAEVLAGFLLMEYVRKRVFVIRTRTPSHMGNSALFCWAQFRDLVTPRKNRQLPATPTVRSRFQPRRLKRRQQIVRPQKTKAPLWLVTEDIVIKKIMSSEDIEDPFASSSQLRSSPAVVQP